PCAAFLLQDSAAREVAPRSPPPPPPPPPPATPAMEGGLRSPPERSTQNVPLTWRFGGGIER
ncbi:MAG: hypothetical protein OXH95_08200, partial [bacterium]|nr:hypothetical protein [bacterium]